MMEPTDRSNTHAKSPESEVPCDNNRSDSGYGSQTSSTIELGRRLKFFHKPIPAAAQSCLVDWKALFSQRLAEAVSKCKEVDLNISVKTGYIGKSEQEAKLCVVFLCNKKVVSLLKRFLKDEHVRRPLESSFSIHIVGRAPTPLNANGKISIFWDHGASPGSSPATLCGLPIIASNGLRSRRITFGGVLMVTTSCKVSLYGMTVGHVFPGLENQSFPSASSSSTDTSRNFSDHEDSDSDDGMVLSDFGDQDEKIDQEFPVTEANTLLDPIAVVDETRGNTVLPCNHDWRLVELRREWWLPNILEDISKNLELSLPEDEIIKSPKEVLIISSRAGIRRGILRHQHTSMILKPGTAFINILDLSMGMGYKLEPGDSGSWVVNPHTGELYGHVIAIDAFGDAYVVPLHSTLEEIKRHLDAQDVSLPSQAEVKNWVAEYDRLHMSQKANTFMKPQHEMKLPAVEFVATQSSSRIHDFFSHEEKLFVLAEIIKTSHVDVGALVQFIKNHHIEPDWMSMQIPLGRNLNQCMRFLESVSLSFPTMKRKLENDEFESFRPIKRSDPLDLADLMDFTGPESLSVLAPYNSDKTANAANYAQQCYSSETSNMLGCRYFVTPKLPTRVEVTHEYPFNNSKSICRSDTPSLVLDTGFLDSNRHLGFNTPVGDRVHSFKGRDGNYTRYHYGSFRYGTGSDATLMNYTFQAESIPTQYAVLERPQVLEKNFLLTGVSASPFNGSFVAPSSFVPTPELARLDADIFLASLTGNGVIFLEPTHDPWYHATQPGSLLFTVGATEPKTIYLRDEAASPIACMNQYQICRGNSPKSGDESTCGPLAGFMDATLGAATLFDLEQDMNLIQSSKLPDSYSTAATGFNWFVAIWRTMTSTHGSLINHMGPSALASQRAFRSGTQGPLPNNQWQIDMSHLWNISLASFQAGFVDAVKGVKQEKMQPYVMVPTNAHQKYLCNNQKILSSTTGSFSLFGLCFTYAFGVLIIVVSFSLEPIIVCCLRRRKPKPNAQNREVPNEEASQLWYKQLEWSTNEVLQQHRLAHEVLGWGRQTWRDCTEYVPITDKGEVLGCLDIRNPEHPVLYTPIPTNTDEVNDKTHFDTPADNGTVDGSSDTAVNTASGVLRQLDSELVAASEPDTMRTANGSETGSTQGLEQMVPNSTDLRLGEAQLGLKQALDR
ncbi:hypothetical protein HJFPF1_02512 [Paramyrothecium foliicola]|nr:hypothetical protein HJFPF1_02512 [Paramyrothecium foliicola]